MNPIEKFNSLPRNQKLLIGGAAVGGVALLYLTSKSGDGSLPGTNVNKALADAAQQAAQAGQQAGGAGGSTDAGALSALQDELAQQKSSQASLASQLQQALSQLASNVNDALTQQSRNTQDALQSLASQRAAGGGSGFDAYSFGLASQLADAARQAAAQAQQAIIPPGGIQSYLNTSYAPDTSGFGQAGQVLLSSLPKASTYVAPSYKVDVSGIPLLSQFQKIIQGNLSIAQASGYQPASRAISGVVRGSTGGVSLSDRLRQTFQSPPKFPNLGQGLNSPMAGYNMTRFGLPVSKSGLKSLGKVSGY